MKTVSLRNRLLKRISTELILFTTLMGFVLTAFLYVHERNDLEHQVDVWVSAVPKTILPHLIDSDHFAITGKVKLIESTGLFSSFSVHDKLKNSVAEFGQESESPSTVPIKDEGGETWGYYAFEVNRATLVRPIVIAAIGLMTLFLGLLWITRRRLKQGIQTDFGEFSSFLDQLERLSHAIACADKDLESTLKFKVSTSVEEEARINDVIRLLISEIRKNQEQVKEFTRVSEKKKHEEKLFSEARQMAHDLRSPAETLRSLMDDLRMVPEEKRTLIREITSTIIDITNDLLDRYNPSSSEEEKGMSPPREAKVELLVPFIERAVSEKRLQYREHRGIEILSELGPSSYDCFAKVDKTQLKRVLSNLLNNAVEALEKKGTVIVKASSSADENRITIQDNGKGIPEVRLPLLMKEGVSFGKTNGMGRGLYHSKMMLESWGGKIGIESKAGQGTTVTITLPRHASPIWFVPEIVVGPDTRVVVLDDDKSIHYVWKKLFSPMSEEGRATPVHLHSAKEFREWHGKNRPDKSYLYLIDYELLKETETGLDIILEHGIETQSILVTSRFEEKSVAEAVALHGLRMIPKEMARYVPVQLSTGITPSYVFLDDNAVTREVWEDSAKDHGIILATFSTPEDLLASLEQMESATCFYIDQDLGKSGETGFEVAKKIYEAGFRNILLATGYRRQDLAQLPWWIKGTVGKQPPWKSAEGVA